MKLRVVLVLASLLVMAGIALYCGLFSPASMDNVAPPTIPADRTPVASEPLAIADTKKSAEPEEPDLVLAPQIELTEGTLPWEQRIKAVIDATEASETLKARQLIAMLPMLPEEALETATREAIDRLRDKEYAPARAALLNPQTHGAVMSVLFADLMERPDAIALPTLLAIARSPVHPLATSARENLDLLLEKDFGNDWLKWDAEVRQVLAAER